MFVHCQLSAAACGYVIASHGTSLTHLNVVTSSVTVSSHNGINRHGGGVPLALNASSHLPSNPAVNGGGNLINHRSAQQQYKDAIKGSSTVARQTTVTSKLQCNYYVVTGLAR
jgi:hypothetical protein